MIYAVVAFMVVVAILSAIRLRRGGPGPAVNGWVPRSLRGRMNSAYKRAGWQAPYDDDGNRSSSRSDL